MYNKLEILADSLASQGSSQTNIANTVTRHCAISISLAKLARDKDNSVIADQTVL